ncbi:MAG: sugar phosphate nucleotidyltransferase [Caulobacteraceae bacterium]
MKAVIMAGGEGTRLRPITCGIPKPMVPVLNKPVMEYTIDLLKSHGITDIAATLAYFPAVITDYFGSGEEWGVNLRYYIEHTPLGTGGSVKNAEDFLDGTFIIVSGDALTDIDVKSAVEFHKNKNSKATLILKKVNIPLEYGVVIIDESGRIIRFLEKPSWGEVFSDTINTGIYILEPEVLDYYKKGDNFDFSKDLFPKLLRDNIPMYGYVTDDYWNDIGDLKVYKEVNYDILSGKLKSNIPYEMIREGIWVGENTSISPDCELVPPVLIGSHCIIKSKTILDAVIIGDHTEIAENSSVKRSILWKNTDIGSNVQCRGSVICNSASIKNGTHLFENTVIGNNTLVEAGAIIKPDIKIWPEKVIEEDAVVNQNMVWGTKVSKTLFGFKDISGDVNTNLTPEFASRLGSAFGSTFNEEARVVISSDGSNAAEIMKDSITSGILSTGVEVIDIQDSLMPILRYAVKFYKGDGGVYIWKDYSEENKVHIDLVNKNGINIDRAIERKIENNFVREDFKRCNAERIKQVLRKEGFADYYIQNGSNLLKNFNRIKASHIKLTVGSYSEQVMNIAVSYLKNMGCIVEQDNLPRKRRIAHEKVDQSLYNRHIAELTVKSGSSMGLVFSEDGENVVLIDHKGRIIDRDKHMALISLIILKAGLDKKLIVPHTASRVIEKMAECYNIEVIRTKNSPADVMKAMLDDTGNLDSAIFQYILNFDAIWGVGSLIDFMVGNSVILYDLVNELPHFHIEKKEVKCDWRYKGRVIREIIEENKNREIELFEGVKINSENGWVLILPDSEKPVCNIYAEGVSEEYARELATIFTDRINDIISTADN